jgi:hypothetical protein
MLTAAKISSITFCCVVGFSQCSSTLCHVKVCYVNNDFSVLNRNNSKISSSDILPVSPDNHMDGLRVSQLDQKMLK